MRKRAVIALSLVAATAYAAPRFWSNTGSETLDIAASPAPKAPVVIEIGANGRPVRALPFQETATGIVISAPPRSKVELWSRSELTSSKEDAFARAAQFGAFLRIAVGPIVADVLGDQTHPKETPAWQTAPARFRAYPAGTLPVSVRVRNDGSTVWKTPRARLFAPDNWTVAPAVATLADAKGLPVKALKPGASGMATFTVKIPSQTTLGVPVPLVGFLRFDAGAKSVTVHNNIEVTVQEPVDRRYVMSEKGDRFSVHIINRFKPAGLGTATVEVRKPIGAGWTIASPAPAEIKAQTSEISGDADAKAVVTGITAPTDQISVPVVVTLNGYRMGYTPIIAVVADYTTSSPEKGLKRLPLSSPTALDATGLTFADIASSSHSLALDAPAKFALSDPTEYVSPTWVTVDLVNGGANRIRLEYDAWDATKPVIAGDMPITAVKGEEETFSFVLPDARFAGKLPGGADMRLMIDGGSATIKKISVTKWNPLKVAEG